MRKTLILAAGFVFLASCSFAQLQNSTDMSNFKSDLSSDLATLAGSLSNTLAPHFAFSAAVGDKMPANVMGLPSFELGAESSWSLFPLDSVVSQKFAFQTLPSLYFALPSWFIHGKVGTVSLPYVGLVDVGARVGFMSFSFTGSNTSVSYSSNAWGVEFRSAVIKDGLTSPCGLSLNLSVDGASSSFNASFPYSQTLTRNDYPTTGVNSSIAVNGTATANTTWDPVTIGLKAVISKNLIFFTPYAGVGVDFNTGATTTTLATNGNVTMTESGAYSGQASDTYSLSSGAQSANPPSTSFRGFVGAEMSLFPMVSMGVSGEFNGKDIGANAGLRLQF